MKNIRNTHRPHNRQPHTPLLRQPQDYPLIDRKQCIQTPDIHQKQCGEGCDGLVVRWETGEGDAAFEEADGLEDREVGATEGEEGLEVEEVDCVDRGDDEGVKGFWRHSWG